MWVCQNDALSFYRYMLHSCYCCVVLQWGSDHGYIATLKHCFLVLLSFCCLPILLKKNDQNQKIKNIGRWIVLCVVLLVSCNVLLIFRFVVALLISRNVLVSRYVLLLCCFECWSVVFPLCVADVLFCVLHCCFPAMCCRRVVLYVVLLVSLNVLSMCRFVCCSVVFPLCVADVLFCVLLCWLPVMCCRCVVSCVALLVSRYVLPMCCFLCCSVGFPLCVADVLFCVLLCWLPVMCCRRVLLWFVLLVPRNVVMSRDVGLLYYYFNVDMS